MHSGKLIFVSGLTGAGKTTLIGAALQAVDNLEVLQTYTTRPKRAGEDTSYEYVFLADREYEDMKNLSNNWDETIYNNYKYGSDAEKYIGDLHNGINVIVAVTPNMDDIRAMAHIYGVVPITIWINTDRSIASNRVKKDQIRSVRDEDDSVKKEFDIIFEPENIFETDTRNFMSLITDLVTSSRVAHSLTG